MDGNRKPSVYRACSTGRCRRYVKFDITLSTPAIGRLRVQDIASTLDLLVSLCVVSVYAGRELDDHNVTRNDIQRASIVVYIYVCVYKGTRNTTRLSAIFIRP